MWSQSEIGSSNATAEQIGIRRRQLAKKWRTIKKWSRATFPFKYRKHVGRFPQLPAYLVFRTATRWLGERRVGPRIIISWHAKPARKLVTLLKKKKKEKRKILRLYLENPWVVASYEVIKLVIASEGRRSRVGNVARAIAMYRRWNNQWNHGTERVNKAR